MRRLLPLLLLTACAPIDEEPAEGEGEGEPEQVFEPIDDFIVGENPRRTNVFVPDSYDPATPMPLLLVLHGYGFTGAAMESLMGLRALSEEHDFIYARPDGTVDGQGSQFWNASDACCDFANTGVDDSAFLRSIVDDVKAVANIGPVFVMGHSNGGFMAHRLACDHADVFHAITAVAGAAQACTPSQPVAALIAHGTDDETIAYAGGSLGPGLTYIGAEASAQLWADNNGCTSSSSAGSIDIETIAGAETDVTRYEGCAASVELWTINGGTHVPNANPSYLPAVIDFMKENAR